jgi:hypothetical protein
LKVDLIPSQPEIDKVGINGAIGKQVRVFDREKVETQPGLDVLERYGERVVKLCSAKTTSFE